MKFQTFSFKQENAFTGETIERTKHTDPYTYEPFTLWGSKTNSEQGVYSDRLYGWKFNKCCNDVWGNSGQCFDSREPSDIEKFLQLYYNKPDLKLEWVVEGCNVSNGYPYWYFGFSGITWENK